MYIYSGMVWYIYYATYILSIAPALICVSMLAHLLSRPELGGESWAMKSRLHFELYAHLGTSRNKIFLLDVNK